MTELEEPEGQVRAVWTPDPVRYTADESYRDAIVDVLEQHFPGRGASPSSMRVIEDETGQRVLLAECRMDAEGDWHVDSFPPYRRRAVDDGAPLVPGVELP